MDEFYLAAVHQYHTPKNRWFSLVDFIASGRGVLLIGLDPESRKTTAPLMQLLFQRLVELLEGLPDNNQVAEEYRRKLFTYIDELFFVGRLRNIDELLSFCPSKGGITYFSCQSVEQPYHLYGRELAESIIGNCAFKLYFRQGSHFSRRWVIDLLGQHRVIERKYSRSYGAASVNYSESREEVVRDLVTTGELSSMLPVASYESGVKFFVDTPLAGVGTFYKEMTRDEVAAVQPDAYQNVPSFVPKPFSMRRFPRASSAEWAQFMEGTFGASKVRDSVIEAVGGRSPFLAEVVRQSVSMMEAIVNEAVDEYCSFRERSL